MNQSDHDLLITLAARMDAMSIRQGETVASVQQLQIQLLGKLEAMFQKFDQMRDEQADHKNRIRTLERFSGDADIRVASLEQKVDTLQDAARTQAAISEAMKGDAKKNEEHTERRLRRWAFVMSGISFFIMLLPKILEGIQMVMKSGTTP